MILVVRNEVDPDHEYHCDALASHFPGAREYDYPAGERPSNAELEAADAIVLTGSTAGVYEIDERPWIGELEALVRELVAREIPTLGVCFGHQVVNSALGGTVEALDSRSRLVDASFDDDPLFDGVDPTVPVVHGDYVTAVGDGLEIVGRTGYYPAFATRHRSAPLWTVQFHPEFTADYRERIDEAFGWSETDHSYDDVNASRVFENFTRLAASPR